MLLTKSDCAYYTGDGTCSFGCWEEPRCITEEPIDGWLRYEAESARAAAWESQGEHGHVKHWRDVARHFAKREIKEQL